jgi:carboxymethylenebutenolidase
MKLAVVFLKAKSTKIASLGWCFGGQQSLSISTTEKLDATVIYYGHLTDDTEKLKKIE